MSAIMGKGKYKINKMKNLAFNRKKTIGKRDEE
jgi:hypothetical protein